MSPLRTPVQVRLATPAQLPNVFAVRMQVFVVEQGVPADIELDALDAAAEHAVALVDEVVIGTARLVDGRVAGESRLVEGTSGRIATIGRMAVLAEYRARGIGRRLLDLMVARAAERGALDVELHAQVHARGFYEAAGFSAVGEVYLEAGLEHVEMRRRLP